MNFLAARVAPIAVGIGLAMVLVVGLPLSERPVVQCAISGLAGSAWIWTPHALVNVPDGGSSAMNVGALYWIFGSGAVDSGASFPISGRFSMNSTDPGVGIIGVVGLAEWDFYSVDNISVPFGPSSPCTQPYLAFIASPLVCGGGGNLTTILPLPSNETDYSQLHFVPPQSCMAGSASPGASIWFDTSYHGPVAGSPYRGKSLDLCSPSYSTPFVISLLGVASYPIVANMTLPGGHTISSRGNFVFSASSSPADPVVTYDLSAGWIWNISAVGSSGQLPSQNDPTTGTLLAFDRVSC